MTPVTARCSPEGLADRRRGDQVVRRQHQVAVVLHHPGVEEVEGRAAVELVEGLVLEGPGDLDGPVAAEVEEDDRVAVGHLPDRLVVLVDDDEGRQELVVDVLVLAVEGLHRLAGRGEVAGLAQDVGLPPPLHDAPVGLVAVHGDDHAPAAGGDEVVEPVAPVGAEALLEAVDEGGGGPLADVAAVGQDVDPEVGHAVAGGAVDEGQQLVDVAVDVAVGEEPDQVERGLAGLRALDDGLPDVTLEEGPGRDGLVHQLGALVEDPAAAQRVVADLAVAHVVVGGQPGGDAVGPHQGVGVVGDEPVQGRGPGLHHRVPRARRGHADAVHDDLHHGTTRLGKAIRLLELVHLSCFLGCSTCLPPQSGVARPGKVGGRQPPRRVRGQRSTGPGARAGGAARAPAVVLGPLALGAGSIVLPGGQEATFET